MAAVEKFVRKDIFLRNIMSRCCERLLRREFADIEGAEIIAVSNGRVTISYHPEILSWKKLEKKLKDLDFDLIVDKEDILVEQIKSAVTELVHNTTYNAMVRNSDFLVGKFNLSYPYLSSVFSKKENITLEKFIINLKIQKVRELLRQEDITLSEIAFMMGYSSVQYLSAQFRKVTGMSVSEFRENPVFTREDNWKPL